jgi:hypothetical protein
MSASAGRSCSKRGSKIQGSESNASKSVDVGPVLFWAYNTKVSISKNSRPHMSEDRSWSQRSFPIDRVTALTSSDPLVLEKNRRSPRDTIRAHQKRKDHNQPRLGAPLGDKSLKRRMNTCTVGGVDLSEYMSTNTLGMNSMERFLDERHQITRRNDAFDLAAEASHYAEDRHRKDPSLEEFFDLCGSPLFDSENHHISSQCTCLSSSWTVGQNPPVS